MKRLALFLFACVLMISCKPLEPNPRVHKLTFNHVTKACYIDGKLCAPSNISVKMLNDDELTVISERGMWDLIPIGYEYNYTVDGRGNVKHFYSPNLSEYMAKNETFNFTIRLIHN